VSTDTRTPRSKEQHSPTGPALRCDKLTVAYDDVAVLQGIDLNVEAGELVALLGASGSGKSTLLHAIAGLVDPSGGEIWLNGERVAGGKRNTPPEQRNVGLVFQDFALWPHIRVIDNVAYPLRRAGQSQVAARATARDLLEKLDIGHLADQRPAQLSGGEQQRVGLARALARNARLYLLDEPTAHLNTHLRAAFQEAVLARRDETGAAIVYATHDAAEALALANRVAIVDAGRLTQVGSPVNVYAEPVSARAAALTGPCSLLHAEVRRLDNRHISLDLGQGDPIAVRGGGDVDTRSRRATVVLRPDWIIARTPAPWAGHVTAVAFRGPHTDYQVESPAHSVLMRLPGPPRFALGDPLPWAPTQAWVLAG
jgi:ABC-type Fe3+/spermidine/putrescine transport system ATPase subunit